MPLLNSFLENNRSGVSQLSVKQIVTVCGNGELRDGNACSDEFRDYLRSAALDEISRYTEECLRASFTDSGFVLQDLMNELGRRLDFEVENGRYRGTVNANGLDGLWLAGPGKALIVEVKTTDAYRINLDIVATYKDRYLNSVADDRHAACLIIVGREDTGDLEAQVRGSRHAWSIRIISMDALLRLVKLKQNADENTASKTRELLFPFEYTRLDKIIDLAFTAASEATAGLTEEVEPTGAVQVTASGSDKESKLQQQHTPFVEQDELRRAMVQKISQDYASSLVRKSRAIFWSTDRTVRAVVSTSKTYPGGWYWYGYHSTWDELLAQAEHGIFALGCIGRKYFFALPYAMIHPLRLQLNMSSDEEGVGHWHIHLLEENGTTKLKVHKTGELLDVDQYKKFLV